VYVACFEIIPDMVGLGVICSSGMQLRYQKPHNRTKERLVGVGRATRRPHGVTAASPRASKQEWNRRNTGLGKASSYECHFLL
jgi:hypothetical protein